MNFKLKFRWNTKNYCATCVPGSTPPALRPIWSLTKNLYER